MRRGITSGRFIPKAIGPPRRIPNDLPWPPLPTQCHATRSGPADDDLTTCDREPIHIPGAILPYGAMLVLDGVDLQVLQAAGDTEALLGLSVDALLGQPAERASLFRAECFGCAVSPASRTSSSRGICWILSCDISNRVPLDASAHRVDGGLVLEFEAAEISDAFAAEPLAAVQLMVEGFGSAASLYKLCQLATESVRHVAR